LQGDAAVAMDYRLTADILTRFAEDLKPGGDDAAAQHARGGVSRSGWWAGFPARRDRPVAATAQ
jgi:hypothetical protein